MTAIKTNPSSSADKACKDGMRPRRSAAPPSKTVDEAKSRFVSTLNKGVDALLEKGHGRERVSSELLSGLAEGCSPDEDEIFQTMESLGLSMEDATQVMTVSTAFRKAKSIKGGSAAAAIDELSSRLNLADLSHSHRGRSSRSPSPTPSVTTMQSSALVAIKMTELARNESVESLQSHKNNAQMAKKGQRPNMTRANNNHHQQGGRGRKRALAEKTPEKRDTNVIIEKEQTNKGKAGAATAAAVSDLDVKEKMLNAKLSKAEGKKPKSSSVAARAKSPEGGLVARGKRASTTVLHVDDQAIKRPRTRSQTEESIPEI